jgi:NAD(P)-dependent dehydrogenase (short-subunit alcohol dehydrogenase family)
MGSKYSQKLVGKKILVVGGTSGIGFGAAEILLDAGAHVIVVSSSPARVEDAVKRLANANVSGKAGDVRDEEAFTELLKSLAPLDHIVFSGVDKIIRGSLADVNLDDAKYLFGVKFWGSVVIGKGTSMENHLLSVLRTDGIQLSQSMTLSIREGR